jgi:hypothetical protein
MTVPMDEWLTIVSYRDFYDIPRLILAVDKAEKYWIFDSKFDNDIDDYSLEYVVHFAGQKLQEAQSVFKRCADVARISDDDATSVPVQLVEFDQTRRRQLLLRSRKEEK